MTEPITQQSNLDTGTTNEDETLTRLKSESYARRRYEYGYRMRVVTTVLPGVLGILLLLLPSSVWQTLLPNFFPDPRFGDQNRSALLVAATAVLLFATSALGIIMFYLQTGFKRDFREKEQLRDYESQFRQLRSEPAERKNAIDADGVLLLEQRLAKLEKDERDRESEFLNATDRQQLASQIAARLEAEASGELIARLERQAAERVTAANRMQTLESQFESSTGRLNGELTALGRRGNLNLGLGIVTTAVGLGLLGYFVVQTATRAEELSAFLIHFIPRFSVVLFIEVFAYFFLRLYKATLSEIKYFQNEITNIESKFAALRTALAFEDRASLATVIEKLASTERNYLLKKGESTVQLKQLKCDNELAAEITKHVTDAVTAVVKK